MSRARTAQHARRGYYDAWVSQLAPLRCLIGWRSGPWWFLVVSDGVGEFGERRGDAETAWGVEAEFVVPAAQVLYERVCGDDRLRGPVGL